nr:MAG TPA: hypothetical protein [Caudoviricetes sp.]
MKYCLAWRPRSLFSTMASSLAISRLMKYSLAAKRPLFSPLIILSTVKSSPSLKPYLRILSLIQFANSCLDSRNFHKSRALTAVILSPFRVIPVVLMSSAVILAPFVDVFCFFASAIVPFLEHLFDQPPLRGTVCRIYIPLAVAEQIHIFRPVSVLRPGEHFVCVRPDPWRTQFFAIIPVVGVADILRIGFRIVVRQTPAQAGEITERKQGFDALFRVVVCMQANTRAGRIHVEVNVNGAAAPVGGLDCNESSCRHGNLPGLKCDSRGQCGGRKPVRHVFPVAAAGVNDRCADVQCDQDDRKNLCCIHVPSSKRDIVIKIVRRCGGCPRFVGIQVFSRFSHDGTLF